MQVAPFKHMAERLLYYWARTYTADLKRSMQYESLDKTIAILISAKNLEQTKGIEKYHTKWNIREEDEHDKIYTDDLEIHIIELAKFKGEEERPEDNWIKFIQGGKEKMDRIEKFEKELQEAIKELEKIENDPEFREEYEIREMDIFDRATILGQAKRAQAELEKAQAELERAQDELKRAMKKVRKEGEKERKRGRDEGRKEGKEEGRCEGKSEGQKELIKTMISNGIEIEKICQMINLSEEEVEKILEN